jgi:hypothetical protein
MTIEIVLRIVDTYDMTEEQWEYLEAKGWHLEPSSYSYRTNMFKSTLLEVAYEIEQLFGCGIIVRMISRSYASIIVHNGYFE